MARLATNGPSLSLADKTLINFKSEFRDSLPLLSVLHANEFEGEFIDPEDIAEVNFYKGAPPQWLNFKIAEEKPNDTDCSSVKRDGYEKLRNQIQKKRRGQLTSTVKLHHQPGSGGTTLAMQVLWDLRKTFRSAVLTGSTSNLTAVANQVIYLFTAGNRDHQNTVLLLLDDEEILDSLQDEIKALIAEKQKVPKMPVVILLNCVRKAEVRETDGVVLRQQLSKNEREKFDKKRIQLSERFKEKFKQFHGFNILQSNFSQEYVQEACAVFKGVRKKRKPRKLQLVAFLSLLNTYEPGSYLLESQCREFLKKRDPFLEVPSLEEKMGRFSHLIITSINHPHHEKIVRMAHPMIAQQSTEFLAKAGVTRNDTARDLMTDLCKNEFPQYLQDFVRHMLTKRMKTTEEHQDRFSSLIQDINKMEGNNMSASVLKVASKTFVQNPFFPQALARLYYLQIKDYNKGEHWAKKAKERDPRNSFIADTLGQVHKNRLQTNAKDITPREMLRIAKMAFDTFKYEEKLAENEQGPDMQGHGVNKVSHFYNNRGIFGYLTVANLLFNSLLDKNVIWRGILTKKKAMESILVSLRDGKLMRYKDLLTNLREEVERKCAFFDRYFAYSKPKIQKDDPSFVATDVSKCYQRYVGTSPPNHEKQKADEVIQKLKQQMACTFPGVLSCPGRNYNEIQLKEITTCLRELYDSGDTIKDADIYLLANIMLYNLEGDLVLPSDCQYLVEMLEGEMPLSPRNSPEQYMLTLLMFWTRKTGEQRFFDFSEYIRQMRCAFEHLYEKHLRSRYLCPLFFLGKGEGLNRIVHRSILERVFCNEPEKLQLSKIWSNEEIFQDLKVQKRLFKVQGVLRNCKVYVLIGDQEIEVEVHQLRKWKPGQVSFYLGFNIRGPLAFSIQANCETCDHVKDSGEWTELEPTITADDEVPTYSLQSKEGRYQCSVSALRWVCRESVHIQYQFGSWQEHMERLKLKQYLPGGPLLDITIIAGKLDEAHLPHFVCKGDNSLESDALTVAKIDTSGDFVELASKVTKYHVELQKPVFSPMGVLIRAGLSVKLHCNVLIYQTDTVPRTLRVYLIPCDPATEQAVEKEESGRSWRIQKPKPATSLQMNDWFSLEADDTWANISPSKLQLRPTYESSTTNLFVVSQHVDTDIFLTLECEQKKGNWRNIVWARKM
ncbi:sterile alpha motif domain-containing protein 9 [Lampris incognitus]|uniref:sterile alpha motif domain-containing protein 9 n=1 Tax=Lampris incognitus TaxID=2546036 RepID=UPI0024B4C0AB|nr:sterile alpha motif domain-containing protein 9 [Lampris incognitus]